MNRSISRGGRCERENGRGLHGSGVGGWWREAASVVQESVPLASPSLRPCPQGLVISPPVRDIVRQT